MLIFYVSNAGLLT